MLLRRITQHVKDQNWFAVGLDFLIVVFGIFVGLQADNWNEQRKARAEEREYLARLSEDASGSLEQGRFMRDFIVRGADRAGVVMRALDECSIEPAARVDFANGLYHLGKVFPPYMVRGTIDELISTGKLAILQSIELRELLDRTIREFERFSLIYSNAESRIAPHVLYVDSHVVYKIDAPQSGDTEVGWEDVDLDLDALCGDPRFYTAIAAARNYAYDLATWHEQTMAAIERFKSAVDAELSRSIGD